MIKGQYIKDIKSKTYIHLNNRAPKYMKQKLTELKGNIDSSTIIVGYFSIPPMICI